HGLRSVRRGDERTADLHLDDHGGRGNVGGSLDGLQQFAHGHGDGGGRRNQRQQHGDGHGPSADGGHRGGGSAQPGRGHDDRAFRAGRGCRHGRGEPDLQLGGDDCAHRGGDTFVQRQRRQHGEERHGHFQQGGDLRLHGDDYRPGRPDGDQQRERDGEPDAGGDHGGPGDGESQRGGDAAVHGHGLRSVRRGDERTADLPLDDHGGRGNVGGSLDGLQQFAHGHGDGGGWRNQRQQHGDGHGPSADGGHRGGGSAQPGRGHDDRAFRAG